METISELIDKLSIVNVKLYMTKEAQSKTTEETSKEELKRLIDQDLSLCRERSVLKKEINTAISNAVKTGSVAQLQEVKQY